LPESVVAGRYRIETLIGIGGMGAVYRASDTFEMKQVALKVLSLVNSTMDMPTAVERFRREARYAHQLRHRNIVPVVNFGQDGSLLYLEMPLVTGGTLKALLKPEHPLPIQQALGYVHDMATAIDAVHAHPQQIVHRDIKPSNMLIHQDDGRLVLADFGIARAMQQEKALTQRGWSLGTEHYIAPEQEQGKAEPSSDIYAMGVVVYQMFTGLLPFQAVIKSRAAELPVPSALNPALPPTVDSVIMRAMDIDPTKRYKSAGAFADILDEAFKGESFYSAPTISSSMVATSTANVIVRVLTPENPCGNCGRENRGSSRFCRHCGQNLDATSPAITDLCQVGYASDRGRKAAENEDMLLIIQGLGLNLAPPLRAFSLFAIADGLSGTQGNAAGGHEASSLAIETVSDIVVPLLAGSTRIYSRHTPKQSLLATNKLPNVNVPNTPQAARPIEEIIEQWLKHTIRQANQVIYHCNADYDTSMASTLTVALLYEYRIYVASIGDSRVYHYTKDKGLQYITRENADAIHNQPYSYLGHNYHIPVEFFHREVAPDDQILLCTDGLWHMVPDEHLKDFLSQGDTPQPLAQALIDAANAAGGEGNVSAIVVRVQ
jgi:serine/threonine protein kinase/serine/threonine protein phosphatase PrpC